MASARGTNYATTDIARYLFGNNITSQEARKIWETSSTETQCTHSTGAGAFQNGITTCYICGMTITRVDTDKDGQNPECEHILPILQAVIYLGLYSHKETRREPGRTFEKFKISPTTIQNPFYNQELVNLEYAWSHRACNQIKSDNIYMDIDDEKFKVDIVRLKGLLGQIWNTNISGYRKFRNVLRSKYPNRNDFINQRTRDRSDLIRRFNAIVEKLNSHKAPYVTLLAGVASMVEGTMSNNVRTQRMTPIQRSIAAKKEYDDKIDKIIKDYMHITTNVLTDYFNRYRPNIPTQEKYENYKKHIVDNMDEYIKIKLIMDFNDMNPKAWGQGVVDMCTGLIKQREGKRETKQKRRNTTQEADYRRQFNTAKQILKNPNKSTINLTRGPNLAGPSLTQIIPNNNNSRANIAAHALGLIRQNGYKISRQNGYKISHKRLDKRFKPYGGTHKRPHKRTHKRTRKRKL